jgi:hypothetical protein
MIGKMLALGSLVAAAPALAQAAPEASDAKQNAPVTAPADGDPITVKGNPEQAEAADRAVPKVVAPKADVEFAIDTEWRKFDKDADDKLDQTEFAMFMKKIRETANTQVKTSEEVGKVNAAAFAEADVDKNKFISRDEMIGLLRGPAA